MWAKAMKRAIVKVQSVLAARVIRQYGPDRTTFDLLQVKYTRLKPPEREYPFSIGQIDLFVRFFVYRPGAQRLKIRLYHADPRRDREKAVQKFGPFPIVFAENSGVRDETFRLPDVTVPLPGTYALELRHRIPHRWDGSEQRILARHYFAVEAEQ